MDVLIVGGGKVGSHLADLLQNQRHRVTLVEANEQVFARLQSELTSVRTLLGDGCDPQMLRDAGVMGMGAVVATTGDDEDNLVVAKLAKHEYRVPRVVARVNNPKNEWLFTQRMGVDIAVSHAAMLARLIHEELSLGDMIPLLKLAGGKVSLAEFEVPATSKTVGLRIDAIKLPSECVLAALLRGGEVVIPRGDTTIVAGDHVLAVVRTDKQTELLRLFG
jgi:trk system potassium uptake protein TrkA